MKLLHGIDWELEAQADEIIFAAVTAEYGKSHGGRDVITAWKAERWKATVVYVEHGIPDPAVLRGSFRRSENTRQTWLNSTEGTLRRSRADAVLLAL